MDNREYIERHKQQQLRKCQLKQLAILQEVDRIFKKNGIEYWLDGGTLLGAVRHGGFIPWDDDIDIAVRYADMERIRKALSEQLPQHLEFQDPEQGRTKEKIIKIRDHNSFYVESGDNLNEDYNKGLYIDIFPFIPYPKLSKWILKNIIREIGRSYSILHKPHYYSLKALFEWPWFWARYIFCTAFWKICCLILPKGERFSNVVENNGYGIDHCTAELFPLGTIEFEGCSFPAPKDPDAYLKDLYRNYMEIPPVEKRIIHSIYLQSELIPSSNETEV